MKSVYFALMIIGVFLSAAHAESWEAVIPEVEKRAAFYLAEANRLGYANLAKNDSDYLPYYRDDHECAILGRMLGLTDVVAEAEHLDTPRIANNLSDNEMIKLFAAGRTLEAWVAQANHALSQTKAQRVQYWNDNCAGSGKLKFAPSLLLTTVPSFSDFPTKTINTNVFVMA